MSKGWVIEAFRKGELRITENRNCPFCNPEHKANVPTVLNAHEEHKWVSKEWFEPWLEARKKRLKSS